MLDSLGKIFDRVQLGWSLWSLLWGSAITGAITAWAASATVWLSSWGPIGWAIAFMTGGILFSMFALLSAIAANKWWYFSFRKKQSKKMPDIDPMETFYKSKRILINDLMPPTPGSLVGRTFEDCDIIGPLNIIPIQSPIMNSRYFSVDYISVTDSSMSQGTIYNARVIQNCIFKNCRFFNVSFLVRESEFLAAHRTSGCNWITSIPPNAKEALLAVSSTPKSN